MSDGRTTSTPTASTAEQAPPQQLPVRTFIAASVGNAVEWYDWTVYATFSIYFATQIFPSQQRVTGVPRHLRDVRPRVLLPAARRHAAGPLRRPPRPQAGDAADDRADGRRLAGDRDPADVLGGRLAGTDPASPRPHRPGHVPGRRGVQRFGIPGRDRAAGPTRPLLVVLLHLHRLGGADRVAARCAPRRQPERRPARELGLADPVPGRRPARPGRSVAAPRHGRDRAVRGERREGARPAQPVAAHHP